MKLSKDRPSHLWILTAIIAVGLALRATRLLESLWYDEIAAWFSFGVQGPGAIVSSFFEPSNHIAHTLLSWCSVRLLDGVIGFELALRLPALLFSLFAVVGVYGMTRCVTGSRTAFLAAALMSVLPVLVLEGTEARGYSMMICFAALANWAFLANLNDERPWRWALYAVLCAAGIWAHFVTAFVPIGHAAWIAWRAVRHAERGRAVRGGLAVAGAALLALALYAPVIPEMLRMRSIFGAAGGDEPRVLSAEGWHAFLQLGGSWYAWAAWPGFILAAVALARPGPGRPRLVRAAAVTLLGLPLFVLTVIAAGSWMYARFALFSLPGAVLLIASGVDALWQLRRTAGLAAGAVVAAVSIADLAVRPAKQPLRDAADFVRTVRSEGESILVVGLAHGVLDLYLADLQPQYSFRHGARPELEGLLRDGAADWIVLYYPNHVSPDRKALLELRGYRPAARFRGWVDWGNGDVVVYGRAR